MIGRALKHFRDGLVNEDPESTLTLRDPRVSALFGARPTAAGAVVTPESAFALSAVWSCIRVIAEPTLTIPLRLHKGDDVVTGTPTARLLAIPAPGQPMGALTATTILHLNGWGNALWAKIRDPRGNIVRFEAIHPFRLEAVKRDEYGELFVKLRARWDGTGASGWLGRRDVVHFKALSIDGLVGVSPIQAAREAIGYGIALEEFGARFFVNGARLSGLLVNTGKMLGSDAREQLKTEWAAIYSGSSNAHKVAVLPGDLDYKPISIAPGDAEFVAQRQFSRTEIAALFNVPPEKIGADAGKSMTYKNLEAADLDYLKRSVVPWLAGIEATLNADEELVNYVGGEEVRFDVDAHLRSDSLTRAQVYTMSWNRWMTVNEIREREHMPPIEGGDELTAPPATDKSPVNPTSTDPSEPVDGNPAPKDANA